VRSARASKANEGAWRRNLVLFAGAHSRTKSLGATKSRKFQLAFFEMLRTARAHRRTRIMHVLSPAPRVAGVRVLTRRADRAARVVAASASPSGSPRVVPGGFVPTSTSVLEAFPASGRTVAPRGARASKPARLVSVAASEGDGPQRGGEDEPDRDEDGLYIGTYSNFFTDPDQIKGVIIFCAFLASFASLGNIGAAILLPILYGQPIESCIQGILFGYYCPP
jgi:hypothetical protein